jgi:hypothetical protein
LFERWVIKNKVQNDRMHYLKRIITNLALIHRVVYKVNITQLRAHFKSDHLNKIFVGCLHMEVAHARLYLGEVLKYSVLDADVRSKFTEKELIFTCNSQL